MAIVLCRVDDRLVHGQVVIGWGRPLGIDLIMLVDDTVAGSAWEQELYRMAVSPDIEVRFVTVAEASVQIPALSSDGRRALVLTGDLETMAALHTANPLARSTKTIAGPVFTAAATRSSSVPRSQPVLETAVSASPTPLICTAASTSAPASGP